MRSVVLLLILFMVGALRAQTPLRVGATKPTDPTLREEILRRWSASEALLKRVLGCEFPCEADGPMEKLKAANAANLLWMRKVLRQHGWPVSDLVSEDGTDDALHLIMRIDNYSLMVEALPLVEAAFREGKTPGSIYAVLRDSILVTDGKPQIYGTVWVRDGNVNGKSKPAAIEDFPNVNKRRAEVGLPPLDQTPEL